MTAFVALLRAVNVGGTGALPMATLKAAATAAGFTAVRTYLASGNLVLASDASADAVREALAAQLRPILGGSSGVLVRTAAQMAAIRDANPFPHAPGNRVVVIFLDTTAPADALAGVTGRADEEIHAGRREFYVHYPAGQGVSKLRIPAARTGTGRNMNTVGTLAAMAAAT